MSRASPSLPASPSKMSLRIRFAGPHRYSIRSVPDSPPHNSRWRGFFSRARPGLTLASRSFTSTRALDFAVHDCRGTVALQFLDPALHEGARVGIAE